MATTERYTHIVADGIAALVDASSEHINASRPRGPDGSTCRAATMSVFIRSMGQGNRSSRAPSKSVSVKVWLRSNGHSEVADNIDRIERHWKAQGKATRRNWWNVLAGNRAGLPCRVAGYTFPVLLEARVRQGLETDGGSAATAPTVTSSDESIRRMPSEQELNAAADVLASASRAGRLIPLIGAGASMAPPLSLPSWQGLAHAMANDAGRVQPTRESLILDELSRGRLLEAVSLYPQGDAVPKSQRQKFFRRTFAVQESDVPSCYRTLADLPFWHCVTTNFDDALRLTFLAKADRAKFEEARGPNFGPLLATWSERRSYVYLHGRAVDYDSLVYSADHYDRCQRNESYREVVRRLFTANSVLAFGFSFGDPAFVEILKYVDEGLGGNTGQTHVAILPFDSTVPEQLLRRANVSVLRYRPSTPEHPEALEILKELSRRIGTTAPESTPTLLSRGQEDELRSLSSIYLSMLDNNVGSTYELASASVVMRVLTRRPERYLSAEELTPMVADLIHCSRTDAEAMVRCGMAYLRSHQKLEEKPNRVRPLASTSVSPTRHRLEPLVEAIETRAITYQSTYRSTSGVRRAIRHVVAYCMLVQGSTVARAFRNQEAADGYQLSAIISESIGQLPPFASQQLLTRCISEVLLSPSPECSLVLFELAHAAYALERVFLNPTERDAGTALRWKVFLDSNVLMRVLSVADPRHRPFAYIVERLRRMGTPLAVLHPFIEEILGNADVVEQGITALKIRDRTALTEYVRSIPLHERSPLLVWFLAHVSSNGWCDFKAFRKTMSLDSEGRLSHAIASLGVAVEGKNARKEMDNSERETLWDYLRKWRGGQRSVPQRVLRRNEATQVLWLVRLREEGHRTWFLSMDSQLRQALKLSRNHRYAGFVMTPAEWAHRLAAVHWGKVDLSGFAELMWSAPATSAQDRVRYAAIDRVAAELERSEHDVRPEEIRDAVDDYFAAKGMSAVFAGAEGGGPLDVEHLVAELVPPGAEAILDAIVRRQRAKPGR